MGRLVKRFGRVVPGEVLDALGEAAAIIGRAREEADVLLTRARDERASIFEDARLTGEATGRAQAEATFTTLLVAARVDAERVRTDAAVAARALAVRMAEKIVGRMVDLTPSVLIEITAAALAAARARAGIVVLRVHPDDFSALEAARPALAARLASAVELRLMADPTVSAMGCIVETTAGRLDARLETQLGALEQAVFGGTVALARGKYGG